VRLPAAAKLIGPPATMRYLTIRKNKISHRRRAVEDRRNALAGRLAFRAANPQKRS